jgi:hypothetical protein
MVKRLRIHLAAFALVLAACQSLTGPGPITTIAPPPAMGPAPEFIPANPRQVVTMGPGPEVLDEAHLQFIESQAGYVESTARSLATYPSSTGAVVILAWDAIDLQAGVLTCLTTVSPDVEPDGGFGCSSKGDDRPFSYSSYSQVAGEGFNEFMVQHSPDALATVLELDDGSTVVIRPGNSTISMHRWNGPEPVRFTMFWNNGTRTSEVLAIP